MKVYPWQTFMYEGDDCPRCHSAAARWQPGTGHCLAVCHCPDCGYSGDGTDLRWWLSLPDVELVEVARNPRPLWLAREHRREFLAGLSPMRRGQTVKILGREFAFSDGVHTRQDWLEREWSKGSTVQDGELVSGDTFYPLGAVELAYWAHLVNLREES